VQPILHTVLPNPTPPVKPDDINDDQKGNHAQALAFAAQTSRIPCHIITPHNSSRAKISAARDTYGAHITFSGPTHPERQAVCDAVAAQTGARFVPPYNHPDIILGAGTAALELQAQFFASLNNNSGRRRLNAIITPCSGGGLLSGTALSCEGTGILVFGAEPSYQGADDARRGFYSGKRIEFVKSETIADGLRTPLGEIPWGVIYERRLVKGMYSAGEEEIKAAMRLVWERMKIVVEPSAVVGLAVALYNEEFRRMVEVEGGEEGWDLGVVFSGGNVDLEKVADLFA
jgi:threonine dehydratase